jgi:1,4-dihydroxy-2-naphthoate octaprenyltransferase
MDRIIFWLKAARAQFFTASIFPVILGASLAWRNGGYFSWGYFFLTLVGAVLIHAGVDLSNDYYDHKTGNDEANLNPTPFSGGSRFIQNKLLTPGRVIGAALLCFALGSIIGLYLNFKTGGNVILIIGIIGVFLGFFYTAGPIRIGYSGFGELAVAIGFGPAIVMGSYYIQARTLNQEALLVSIPTAILIAMVLYINEFLDYEADKKVNKNNLVVQLGRKKAIIFYQFFLIYVYLFITMGIISGLFSLWALITFVTLPLAYKASRISRCNFENTQGLLPANAATIALHSLVTFLLAISFILDKIF